MAKAKAPAPVFVGNDAEELGSVGPRGRGIALEQMFVRSYPRDATPPERVRFFHDDKSTCLPPPSRLDTNLIACFVFNGFVMAFGAQAGRWLLSFLVHFFACVRAARHVGTLSALDTERVTTAYERVRAALVKMPYIIEERDTVMLSADLFPIGRSRLAVPAAAPGAAGTVVGSVDYSATEYSATGERTRGSGDIKLSTAKGGRRQLSLKHKRAGACAVT